MANDVQTYRQRYRAIVLLGAICAAFLAIALKLYVIQIVKHDEYRLRSEENAMRIVPIAAVRGRILDRNGEILVGNRPAYTVGVIPAEVTDAARLDSVLAPVVQAPPQTLADKLAAGNRRLHRPVGLQRDTPFSAIAYLEEHRHDLPGVIYLVESRRRYPYGSLGAHLLGYVREVRPSQLTALKQDGYSLGDLMGQAGIEAEYESALCGEKGEEYQEVTAAGRIVQSHRRESVRGSDVRLSIDLRLQQVTEDAMNSVERGAAVVMDPRNGEILALVSRPAFDPDIFSFVVSAEAWRRLNDDVERPLFNRATMGVYPPGSTAKMIAAISAFENDVLTLETRFVPCRGYYRYGNRTYSCWLEHGHGSLTVVHAIESSCNVFFYQVGERLGLTRWAEVARKFGFGQATGVDVTSEDNGLVASTEVYDRRYGRYRWGAGEALNVAIGQGITLVTPIQMARYAAALGTGYLVRPHFAVGFLDADGRERTVDVSDPVPVEVDSALLATIREAMILVTEGPGGTARRSRVPGYHVAGKTGTAQNPHGEPHAWYVGYVPAEDPVIAVAIICENAGHGSEFAAPIAGRIFRAHLLEQPTKQPTGETRVAARTQATQP